MAQHHPVRALVYRCRPWQAQWRSWRGNGFSPAGRELTFRKEEDPLC
jgi:hypothetical protein